MTNLNKSKVRLALYLVIIAMFAMISYATLSFFSNFSHVEQQKLMLLLAFIPTIFFILLYGEMRNVFDEKVGFKDMTKQKKMYLVLVIGWMFIFISLLLYSFVF